ncbi:MAG: PadR family transcriptional regulator [Dehalococcoidia bacterium]|nr:MAG: PadR family transcriptional regulator [Dehalococcoidia bacterium]
MYGYQIIKELEKRSNGYFQFKEGTLYPALHRLEKAGVIQGKWQRLPTGQERRYYYITQKGQKALTERLTVWQNFSAAMDLVIQPASG